jgi:transglutaminase-like putative cysteine protease
MVIGLFSFRSTLCGRMFILLPFLFIAGCGTQTDIFEHDWTRAELDSLPVQRDYPEAGAVVLLNRGRMEVYAQKDLPFSVFEEHKVVRILNDRGKQYANIVIPYSTGSEVKEIEARTISPNAIVTSLDETTIYDVSLYPNYVFFSDQRAKIFTLPAVEDGSVMECYYQIVIHDPTLWHAWNFQESIPTLRSTFTLVEPSEWQILYRSYGPVGGLEIKTAPQGFKSTYTWETKNVPALKAELAMPPQRELLTRIALAPIEFKSWNDVARWFNDLWSPRLSAGTEIKELAAEITRGAVDNEEKLRRIFAWVQLQVRYIAVEIGIGGYQPHSAGKICANRYGDCKDMTALLCALARETGIDVYPAFISTWMNGRPDTSLPSPLQFDHVIVSAPALGTGGVWLDATDKGCPFGQLPWYDQGLPVLIVRKDGRAELAVTPRTTFEQNGTVMDWNVRLDTAGSSVVAGRSVYTGAAAAKMRNDLIRMAPENRHRWFEMYLARQYSGTLLDSLAVAGLSPVEDSLTVTYSFTAKMFAEQNSRRLIVHPWSVAMLDLPDYFRARERTHPLRFQFGERTSARLNILLPDGVLPASPGKDTVHTQFGSAGWQWSFNGSTLTASKEYFFVGDEIEPENYPAFRQFLDNIRRLDNRELILEMKAH